VSTFTVPIETSKSGNGDLAKSPEAIDVMADVDFFRTGDPVMFTVDLDASTIDYPFFGYNVKNIIIYRENSFGDIDEIKDLLANPGQTKFDIPWTADADGSINNEGYYAFVTTKALPRLALGDEVFGELELKKVSADQNCPEPIPFPNPGLTIEYDGEWSGQLDSADANTKFTNFELTLSFILNGSAITGHGFVRRPGGNSTASFQIVSGTFNSPTIQFTAEVSDGVGIFLDSGPAVDWADTMGTNQFTFDGTMTKVCLPPGSEGPSFPVFSGDHSLGGEWSVWMSGF
jgi:hypothetical protein